MSTAGMRYSVLSGEYQVVTHASGHLLSPRRVQQITEISEDHDQQACLPNPRINFSCPEFLFNLFLNEFKHFYIC